MLELNSIIKWLRNNQKLVDLKGSSHRFFMRVGHLPHKFVVLDNLLYHKENLFNLYKRINVLKKDNWRKQLPVGTGIGARISEAVKGKQRLEAIFFPIQNNITSWALKVATELREDGYHLRDLLKQKRLDFKTGVRAQFKEFRSILNQILASLGKPYSEVDKKELEDKSALMLKKKKFLSGKEEFNQE